MKALLAFILALGFSASASVDSEIKNDPPGKRNCAAPEDFGKWGYLPHYQAVDQLGDDLIFDVRVLNLVCTAKGWVLQMPESITKTGPQGQPLKLVNLASYVHETEGFRQAAFSDDSSYKDRQEFNVTWDLRGFSKEVDKLKSGASLSKQYFFGLRATYAEVEDPEKTYYSFSGRYIITVTWTKEIDGSIDVRSNMRRN